MYESPAGYGISRRSNEEVTMGLADKAKNKAEEAKGKAKVAVGKATNDRSVQRRGKADQGSANLKQAGEKVKDVVKDA
jgi:uncharacterized protein YjbJ (UPF0337 family)